MKRVGIWLLLGVFGLSLAYLFQPHQRRAVLVQPAAPPSSLLLAERINLNTATVEELASLPGIGLTTATRVVEYREKHGPFARPEDLLIIKGLGESTYRALAELIKVE